jgi:hypothetical protein
MDVDIVEQGWTRFSSSDAGHFGRDEVGCLLHQFVNLEKESFGVHKSKLRVVELVNWRMV